MTTTAVCANTAGVFRAGIDALTAAHIPHLVYGAIALERLTGIRRPLHDFDLVVRPCDCDAALRALAAVGFRTESTFPHWLGKAFAGDQFIDIIFSSGNGVIQVDDDWFAYAEAAEVFERDVWLCPAEETIWSKAFVMERERFDGADIAHIIMARLDLMDWPRLNRRFGEHWQLLLAHLILFSYIYPTERARLPQFLLVELLQRLEGERRAQSPDIRVCRGTLLSREQYLSDISSWGYEDARLHPHGQMSAENIAHWTAAIANNVPGPPVAK